MDMKRKKKNFYQLLILLFLGIGIGYAALTTDLSINGISHVTQSNWSIHFDNIQVDSNSSATVNQAATITGDTSLSYNITLSVPGDYYEFTVDVVNDGTVDGMIESVSSKLNNVEITTLPSYLEYSVTYYDDVPIAPNHLLAAGDTETYRIHVGYKKDITPEELPEDDVTLHLLFSAPHKQPDENAIPKPNKPVIKPVNGPGDRSAFRDSTYKTKIVTITLDDEINPPANAIKSWDIGVHQNGDVMAYITANVDDNTKYDLTIQGDGALYANPNSSYLFYNLSGVDSINNIDVLNISEVTDMSHMFEKMGQDSTIFTLDLGNNFDTSQVTNMNSMFNSTGSYNNTIFTLDLGDKFDTSNVTDMASMFSSTGFNSTVFTLDLGDKFDTSNVTNMAGMFMYCGHKNTTFTLDLGDKFDTSKVTNMSYMFYNVSFSSRVFTLNLGDKFDTSNVTNMSNMFAYTGYGNSSFTLDLGELFDTSKVTNMTSMFECTGDNNTTFTLDVSNFDFTNVINLNRIFFGFSRYNKIYVKNAFDQNWIITNCGNSNLTTSNVLIKS